MQVQYVFEGQFPIFGKYVGIRLEDEILLGPILGEKLILGLNETEGAIVGIGVLHPVAPTDVIEGQ